MAGYDFEFYETGKISVTAGQKGFTGSGTAWKLRGCEGALVVVVDAGTVNFVSSLSTDAAGEFRTEWTGPDLVDASYVMWLPSAVAATALANHQRLAEIIASIQTAQPANDILAGLAALQPANNQMIYSTGPKTFETSPLTLFARSLLDDGDSEAMLTTLGLTGDKIERLALGSFGVYAPSSTDTNLDNLIAGDRGLYAYTVGGIGFPPETGGLWWIETQAIYNTATTTAVRQTATRYNPTNGNTVMYVRTRHSSTGVWGQWLSLTGGQFGSNPNGIFFRHADGTQTCFSPRLAMGQVSTQTGSFWRTDRYSWSFPASFVTGSVIVHANDDVSSDLFSGCTTNASDTVAVINLNYYQNLTSNRYARAVARGRWF